MNVSDCGIVVPTLGTRIDFLMQSLNSIRHAGNPFISIVCPKKDLGEELLKAGYIEQFVVQTGCGIANAINLGFSHLPDHIKFVGWLGDDDLLEIDSISMTRSALIEQPGATGIYGHCQYINALGEKIGANKSGRWASRILCFGPNLVPQPGSLFRRASLDQVGGLDESYECAFDLDLFIKLKSLGRLIYIDQNLASFRWHPDSMSVLSRNISVSEASKIRVSHLPKSFRFASFLWETPIKVITKYSGSIVNFAVKSRPI
jgi:GT2 family glycosyltransferase